MDFAARKRVPRNYDGPLPTARPIQKLLPSILRSISHRYQDRPEMILVAWPEVIGSHLASMTEAVSFHDGVLHVRVRNSTLYSLLTQVEKPRILQNLRQKFPGSKIKTISFRMG
ncbi:MAG: hypothetical protein K940chlam9_00769 [Chlamydiae bacterium]|nr:hypothetical protein [Chlamydiota bacterium]